MFFKLHRRSKIRRVFAAQHVFCFGLILPIVKYLLVLDRFDGLPLGRSRAKIIEPIGKQK